MWWPTLSICPAAQGRSPGMSVAKRVLSSLFYLTAVALSACSGSGPNRVAVTSGAASVSATPAEATRAFGALFLSDSGATLCAEASCFDKLLLV